MRSLHQPDEMRRAAERLRREGASIGFVPTMGYLHEGHLSLIRKARLSCDQVVVSIFVNPTQFGPTEDFDRYPRDLQRDSALCLEADVDLLFVPSQAAMYLDGCATRVHVAGLTEDLCGASRPGHFDGVTTVVAKLLSLVRPHQAFFGEKDYQQLVVVRRMVEDLNLGVEIVGCPIVRESDGLAMSSRNVRLTPEQRAAAPSLYRGLEAAAAAVAAGRVDVAEVVRIAWEPAEATGLLRRDYLEVRDPTTLAPVERIDRPVRFLVAARLGDVRLIDNLAAMPTGGTATRGG